MYMKCKFQVRIILKVCLELSNTDVEMITNIYIYIQMLCSSDFEMNSKWSLNNIGFITLIQFGILIHIRMYGKISFPFCGIVLNLIVFFVGVSF